MWAWPVATTRWAPRSAGHGEHRREHGPGGDRPRRRSRPAGGRARRAPATMAARMPGPAGVVEGERAHHPVEHVEVVDAAPRRRRRRRRARPGRGGTAARSPAVSGEPSGDGRNCGNIGFDAASTTSSTGPGSPATGTAWRRGWMPCTGRPLPSRTRPSHWKPGRVEPEAEVEQRLDTAARPRRRDLAREAEPRRAPRRTPAVADGERREVVERRTGLDGQRAALRVHERQHPLGQLPGDPLLDQLPVVVHRIHSGVPGDLTGRSQLAPRFGCGCCAWLPPPRRPSTDHDDDHDRGLQFDMSTLLARRRVLSCSPAPASPRSLAALRQRRRRARPGRRRARRRRPATAGTTGTTAPRRPPTGDDDADASCSPIPEETAGPFPGDGSNGVNVLTESGVVRSDIRASFGSSTTVAEGVPLTIELTVADTAAGCAPLAGAAVYVWHCDRDGNYSMYSDAPRRELPPRRAGDRRRRAGDVHQHLPGVLLGALAAHPLRGVPEPGRGDRAAATSIATSQLALPGRTPATSCTPPTGYEQSVRNLGQAVAGDGQRVQRRLPPAAGDDDAAASPTATPPPLASIAVSGAGSCQRSDSGPSQTRTTSTASGPLRPARTANSTRWPVVRAPLVGTFVWCTNTSWPAPPSMNP